MFFLIFSFLLPLFFTQHPSILDEKKNVSSPLYDFQGICTEMNKKYPEYLCLPYYPVTYDDLFRSKYFEAKLKETNEWFQLNPYFGQSKLEVRKKGEGELGVFAKENITTETILYKFNEYDIITPFSLTGMMKNSSKKDDLEGLPALNLTGSGDGELIFALLMHLYWNKYSHYKPLMRFFPEKVDIPLFTMTPYEIELFKGDDVYDYLLMFRKGALESYIFFDKEMKKKWTEEQIEVFCRHSELPIEDFMYTNMLFIKYGWEEKEYEALKKKPHFFIPLGLHLFGKKIYEKKISYRRLVDEDPDEKDKKIIKRIILTVNNITKDEELSLNTGVLENDIQINKDWEYFLLKGYVPIDNDKDCIDLYIMEKTVAESWGAPTITCFNLANKRIKAFHAVGNLMNMNDAQYQQCKSIVDTRKSRAKMHSHEDEKVMVFEKCAHPAWTQVDIWERPLIELDDKIKMYSKKLNKAKKYSKLRKTAHLSAVNADLMIVYFRRKLELCKVIKNTIHKLLESPRQFIGKDEL